MEEVKESQTADLSPPVAKPYPLEPVSSQYVKHISVKGWDFYFTNMSILLSKELDKV
jgi:hypothetical protein